MDGGNAARTAEGGHRRLTDPLQSAYPALLPTSFEHSNIEVGEGSLSADAADEFCRSPYGFKYTKRTLIRTGNYAGVIAAHG